MRHRQRVLIIISGNGQIVWNGSLVDKNIHVLMGLHINLLNLVVIQHEGFFLALMQI